MIELTEKQKETHLFVCDFLDEKEYPPTIREISEHFGVGIKAIFDRLTSMQKKGYVDWVPNTSRTLRILRRLRDERV